MADKKYTGFTLPSYDELFTTQEMRDEEKLVKIREIAISEIDDFPDHPFQVRDDEDMMQLVESIRERGVITPATVRRKADGRYEMISGHRRKRACELAGLDTLRCEVVELTKDEAVILMCESNLQRSQILPSEKAFAYKMRMEALRHQGKRTDLTSDPLGPKLVKNRSNEELSGEVGDSITQIKRYIRLTDLVPELLEYVDTGKIKLRPAVELSYLEEDFQRELVDWIDENETTPSFAQAQTLRRLNKEGTLTPDMLIYIMAEEKPNQRERLVFATDRITPLLPKDLPVTSREDYICQALENYSYERFLEEQHIRKSRSRDAR